MSLYLMTIFMSQGHINKLISPSSFPDCCIDIFLEVFQFQAIFLLFLKLWISLNKSNFLSLKLRQDWTNFDPELKCRHSGSYKLQGVFLTGPPLNLLSVGQ